MPIERIRSFIAQDMSAVDAVIRQKLHSQVALIHQIGEYIIHNGGKRLRPALVILSAGVFNYSGQHHHSLAAVVEFIHTATLLHDDVVDESQLRRNKATANALFGNASSVLVGDFLYSRSFQMMVEVDNMRIMKVLSDATNIIAEGEVLQLLNCRDPDVEEENYLRVIRFKTAKLFEAAARIGAILGNATQFEEEALAIYGMHLGTAFQLIDDLLDYSGDYQDTGKNLGDDLAEGKPTLPLIYAMRTGSDKQASVIREAIKSGGASGFQTVLEIIQQTGALDYAQQRAQKEAEIAAEAIAKLSDSSYKECLLQLAHFAVTRNH
ncbi:MULTISPECIES: octaprenyl diphosphate synthase [Nitrosomonas]|uniref:Octaprenyl diphosphate synthase n=1 Tax=Nitrosomonas communis TaxID=44574 RepID=A0A0F7K9P6_9PROT|nr:MULTISPECIES: octaprenyl diphosphate synthase [Nitrosomonas]AKH36990.1 octaprenyl diphosphate synthase [Nitrosomonas communis]TYP93212.1 octaprenyl-diphosphate synthase [Nitrosomonas communis]UVS62131.1 octaprenyl diphosphate synthase [Nitrosomonas sp. PLL12]